jgi:hypothetical protein
MKVIIVIIIIIIIIIFQFYQISILERLIKAGLVINFQTYIRPKVSLHIHNIPPMNSSLGQAPPNDILNI